MVAPPRPGQGARPASRTPPTIFVVAGEASGDQLGAALIAAIHDRLGAGVRFVGVGGPAMAAQGVPSLFPTADLAIIGLAIVGKLPLILRRIRETASAVVAARPDVLVIIDSPDFTHRVARRVRAAAPEIPIVDYVSPSVWAWRPSRARTMRRYVDHVLALLPFEPAAHAELGGPPCSFVGHPLSEVVDTLRPDPGEVRRRLADPPLVLMLPGSRGGEIRRMLRVFAETIAALQDRRGPIEVVLPTVPELAPDIRAAAEAWPFATRIVVDAAEKRASFRTARAALAKSGTVTLELALAGVPMVTAYQVSGFEAFVARRLIRVPTVILANLVMGENVVPEFLQEACRPAALAAALSPLLDDSPERRQQTEAFARLDAIMRIGSLRPSARAADIVLAIAAGDRPSGD